MKDLDENDPEVYESIYYKEVPIESKKISETLIVTYSPKYKAYQEKIRQGQIDRAKNMISKNGKIKKNRKIRMIQADLQRGLPSQRMEK